MSKPSIIFSDSDSGGRDNAKMVKKSLLQTLSLPTKDGNYFLRADRIVGAFLLPANEPPIGRVEANSVLALEREEDKATKERIDLVQRDMIRWSDQLQETNKELRRRSSEGAAVSCEIDTANSGDIELHGNPTQLHNCVEGRFPATILGFDSDSLEPAVRTPKADTATSEHEKRRTEHIFRQSMSFRVPQGNMVGMKGGESGGDQSDGSFI
jgi:hypothetical protein